MANQRTTIKNKEKGPTEPYESYQEDIHDEGSFTEFTSFAGATDGTDEQDEKGKGTGKGRGRGRGRGKGKGKDPATSTETNQDAKDDGDGGDSYINGWGCSDCKRRFGKKFHLDRHIREQHSTDSKRYGCTFTGCGYDSVRKGNLKQHMENAHGELWGDILYKAALEVSSSDTSDEDGEASETGEATSEDGGKEGQK